MTENNATTEFVAYTVIDADKFEKFVTEDFQSHDRAARRRNELALTYGKQFCLRVAGIDKKGRLHEIDE